MVITSQGKTYQSDNNYYHFGKQRKTCYRIGNYVIIEVVRIEYETTNKRDLRGTRN
jgi:hypothetical protein